MQVDIQKSIDYKNKKNPKQTKGTKSSKYSDWKAALLITVNRD